MKSVNQIRQEFIDFFKSKDHTEVTAAPVIPFDDPTLLFTNAGMNQFKDIFLGTGKREYVRAADSQKCIRAGGKHNDLDEVGKDGHHHSFFEMLGNWSFGDYYKKEAIGWAWELLTEVWKLPKEKLHASVYTTDDESLKLWEEVTDIDRTHITRHGDKDNFWSMGDTGPCGPCSEIHYDRGEKFCNKKDVPGHVCEVNGDCDRIMEIWNLVFMQYDRDEKGNLHDLPARHVDTGMGLERVSMILQNTDSNYHTDIFMDLINEIEKLTSVKYQKGDEGIPFRVIADHIRTLGFAISDGGLPGNEGRGYVLRRILRRASRYGSKLGQNQPFIYKLADKLTEIMGEQFPELKKYKKHVANIIKAEETSFLKTLSKGISLFNEIADEKKNNDNKIIDGETSFRLYDTFGFPPDLTAQMAEEAGLTIDTEGFNREMDRQKQQSKKNKKFKADITIEWIELNSATESKFTGYDEPEGRSKIVKYFTDGKTLKIVPETSYFYAESGGQVADKGTITIADTGLSVTDVQKDGEFIVISAGLPKNYALPPLDDATILIQKADKIYRDGCRIHHSATHLLQSAMKIVLGDHIAQSGSYVDNRNLRFDYSHYEKLTDDQIEEVERIVNGFIRNNYIIETSVMPVAEAKKLNVTALFGEKYGDVVRVLTMGEVSAELCGGTHAVRTGDIGYFKIVTETSIAAGIRRIEAVCGEEAVLLARKQQFLTEYLKENLACKENQIRERVEKLFTEKRETEKELNNLKEKLALMESESLIQKVEEKDGIKFISEIVNIQDAKALKSMAEHLRSRLGENAVIMLGADLGGKVSLVCAVTDDIKNTCKAGVLVGAAAKIVGGGGGGAPHMATAGGKDVSRLAEAVKSVFDNI